MELQRRKCKNLAEQRESYLSQMQAMSVETLDKNIGVVQKQIEMATAQKNEDALLLLMEMESQYLEARVRRFPDS